MGRKRRAEPEQLPKELEEELTSAGMGSQGEPLGHSSSFDNYGWVGDDWKGVNIEEIFSRDFDNPTSLEQIVRAIVLSYPSASPEEVRAIENEDRVIKAMSALTGKRRNKVIPRQDSEEILNQLALNYLQRLYTPWLMNDCEKNAVWAEVIKMHHPDFPEATRRKNSSRSGKDYEAHLYSRVFSRLKQQPGYDERMARLTYPEEMANRARIRESILSGLQALGIIRQDAAK